MNREEFCKKLKKARLEANIKQDIAAKELNIAVSAVSAMESGIRKVDAIELYSLAKLYKKKIEWFFNSGNEEGINNCYNNKVLNEAYNLIEKASPELQTAISYAVIGFLKEGRLVK